jgi:hypothetical protein
MRKAEITDTSPDDFIVSTANLCTTISAFPLFGDLGIKVEERKCADLRHRELRNIHALLLVFHTASAGPHFSTVADAAAFLSSC